MKKIPIQWSSGYATESLMMLVIIIGSILIAGVFLNINNPQLPGLPATLSAAPGSCCDTADCTPLSDPAHLLTYNSSQYGLLKSNVTLREGGSHLKDSGQTFNGNPLILNVTDGFKTPNGNYECGQGKLDQIWNINGTPKCFPIPNDEILYVCKSGCFSKTCSGKWSRSCYGTDTTIYDIYFRLSDLPNPGVPQPIKDCTGTASGGAVVVDQTNPTIVITPYDSHHSEQLHTLGFITPTPYPTGSTAWISPYCKPAIYLYPERSEEVQVKIAPKGRVLTTIPLYPSNGWDVNADPDGTIRYQNKTYPYLYYEAAMPDSVLTNQREEGYVRAYDKLSDLFVTLLPEMGLNEKESEAFSEYWLKALPKSPYYKVTIVPQALLDEISPLTITPLPQTTIRVTLYFQPLERPVYLAPPQLQPVRRQGFTMVEWGGLFKKDKNHPFTCLQ